MANTIDQRPSVTVGHVRLPVKNVLATSASYKSSGCGRFLKKTPLPCSNFAAERYSILEKSRNRTRPGTQAPVDFMKSRRRTIHHLISSHGGVDRCVIAVAVDQELGGTVGMSMRQPLVNLIHHHETSPR